MFAVHALTVLLALAVPLLVQADVNPSEPGPGDSFNAGSTCRIVWLADKDSTTVWKDMSIQLMSGSNLGMEHITTVATKQDGTIDGRFEYPCPEVTPNSAIYFYQFTSPHTDVKTWTTRFTIASASGATTPPANPTQPGSNDPIPWGIGNLVDPSKAVDAPVSGTAAPSGSGSVSTTKTANATTSTTSGLTKVTTSTTSTNTSTSNISTPTGKTSDAHSTAFVDRVLMTTGAFVFAALLW